MSKDPPIRSNNGAEPGWVVVHRSWHFSTTWWFWRNYGWRNPYWHHNKRVSSHWYRNHPNIRPCGLLSQCGLPTTRMCKWRHRTGRTELYTEHWWEEISCVLATRYGGARVAKSVKPWASALMAWVRTQLNAQGFLDASLQQGSFTCLMTRLSSALKSSSREYDRYPTPWHWQ